MPVPDISIVLPVRNAETTVRAALDSCCQQTMRRLEIIVVDDASDDQTSDILTEVALQDSRVRVLKADSRLGVARAFQWGFEHATGKLIARMDADDVNEPERLERQYAMLQAQPDLSGVSCLVRIRKRPKAGGAWRSPDAGYVRFESWLNELIEPEAIASQRFIDQPVVNPTMIVRRSVLELSGGYQNLAWAEDYDLWLRLIHDGHRFAKVPEILFTWTDHDNRLTRTDAVYSQDQFLRCKAYYLSRLAPIRDQGVAVAGAGPIGKTLAKYLRERDIIVHRFYDVHPRRVGEDIGGTPVHDLKSWLGAREDFPMVVLGAVGQPGKRSIIVEMARDRGYVEGETFYSVA